MTVPSPPFLARKPDLDRLFAARAVCYVVSGYDGAGNYGDVLQVSSCLETVRAASPDVVPVVLVDFAAADEFSTLERATPGLWERCVPLFYPAEGLYQPVSPSSFAAVTAPPPVPSLLVVGGGGFLNQHWGPEKLDLIDRLISWQDAAPNPRSRCERPLAFGQQVSAWALADPAARHFLANAACLGVRDRASLARLDSIGETDSGRVFFSGDEAALEIARLAPAAPGRGDSAIVITAHVSLAMNPRGLTDTLVSALTAVAARFEGRLTVQFVAAHEDARISETEEQRPAVEALRAAGVRVTTRALYPDPTTGIAAIAAGQVSISCSYHVALTSLLLGVPTVLVQGDPYYDEKHGALAEIFGLPDCVRFSASDGSASSLADTVMRLLEDAEARATAVSGLATGALAVSSAQVESRRRLTEGIRDMLDSAAREDLSFAHAELHDSLARLSDLRLMNNHVANEGARLLGDEATRQRAAEARRVDDEARLSALSDRVTQLTAQVERLTAGVAELEGGRSADHRAVELLEMAARDREANLAALADKDRHIAHLEGLLVQCHRTIVERATAAVSRTFRRKPRGARPDEGPVAPE